MQGVVRSLDWPERVFARRDPVVIAAPQEVGMKTALRRILWLCAIVVASSAAGQQPEPPLDAPRRTFQDPLFDQLTGRWTMAGAVRARPVNYSIRAEWTLNHQFLKLGAFLAVLADERVQRHRGLVEGHGVVRGGHQRMF